MLRFERVVGCVQLPFYRIRKPYENEPQQKVFCRQMEAVAVIERSIYLIWRRKNILRLCQSFLSGFCQLIFVMLYTLFISVCLSVCLSASISLAVFLSFTFISLSVYKLWTKQKYLFVKRKIVGAFFFSFLSFFLSLFLSFFFISFFFLSFFFLSFFPTKLIYFFLTCLPLFLVLLYSQNQAQFYLSDTLFFSAMIIFSFSPFSIFIAPRHTHTHSLTHTTHSCNFPRG